jgi:hypothetical protein
LTVLEQRPSNDKECNRNRRNEESNWAPPAKPATHVIDCPIGFTASFSRLGSCHWWWTHFIKDVDRLSIGTNHHATTIEFSIEPRSGNAVQVTWRGLAFAKDSKVVFGGSVLHGCQRGQRMAVVTDRRQLGAVATLSNPRGEANEHHDGEKEK